MFKKITTSLVIVLLSVSISYAFQQGPSNNQQGAAMNKMGRFEKSPRNKDFLKESLPVHEKVCENKVAIGRELVKDNPDKEIIRALSEKQRELHSELQKIRSKHNIQGPRKQHQQNRQNANPQPEIFE